MLTPEEVPHEVPGLSLGMLGLSYAIGIGSHVLQVEHNAEKRNIYPPKTNMEPENDGC